MLDDSDKQHYLSWSRKREILREFSELSPYGGVVICGGESMLDLEEYFTITAECRRMGLRTFSVINGTGVTCPEMADRMIREGPDEVSVSLDSHLEAVHDRVRGVKGSFRMAVRALRLLLNARRSYPESLTRIHVMALIYDENYRDLDAFYDFVLNNLKADKLKLNFLQPTFGNNNPSDDFFASHYRVDPDELMSLIIACGIKYRLNLNQVWIDQVGMYFRSLNSSNRIGLGWLSSDGTSEHICNTYERNIMVDLYGFARLCFSPVFPGTQLNDYGDMRRFWEGSNYIRTAMKRCKRYCGISHSVRRETSTLASRGRMCNSDRRGLESCPVELLTQENE